MFILYSLEIDLCTQLLLVKGNHYEIFQFVDKMKINTFMYLSNKFC